LSRSRTKTDCNGSTGCRSLKTGYHRSERGAKNAEGDRDDKETKRRLARVSPFGLQTSEGWMRMSGPDSHSKFPQGCRSRRAVFPTPTSPPSPRIMRNLPARVGSTIYNNPSFFSVCLSLFPWYCCVVGFNVTRLARLSCSRLYFFLYLQILQLNPAMPPPTRPKVSRKRSAVHSSNPAAQKTEVKIHVYDLLPVSITLPYYQEIRLS